MNRRVRTVRLDQLGGQHFLHGDMASSGDDGDPRRLDELHSSHRYCSRCLRISTPVFSDVSYRDAFVAGGVPGCVDDSGPTFDL